MVDSDDGPSKNDMNSENSSDYLTCYSMFWDSIANKPHESLFTYLTTRGWYNKWTLFENALINKADKVFTGSPEDSSYLSSLRECLRKINPTDTSKIAYVPIAAYLIYQGVEPVWFICCKWEGAGSHKNYHFLGHLCGWGIRIRDLNKICFITCG